MTTVSVLRAAGATDAGRQREVNEDRFHVDIARRLFMVVDGIGGQAAGGKAADTAVSMLRSRLERETGPAVARVREAITIANNEIYRLAGVRPEWNGMACVLTVVVLQEAGAIVGHVGDTRLYKIAQERIDKITRDHSPVGEREDANELTELEAMHHPRRNEVYRDVGSERHDTDDPEFVDVRQIQFEPDTALLLCSDGLTDLVEAESIGQIVRRWAGQPQEVVKALVEAANDAGGKDNVTVVYIEGEQFASVAGASRPAEITRRLNPAPGPLATRETAAPDDPEEHTSTGRRAVRWMLLALLTIVIVLATDRSRPVAPLSAAPDGLAAVSNTGRIVVQPTESIGAVLQNAAPGTTLVVEPGEYRETLALRSYIRVVSRIPRGAVIRLPGSASDADAAIEARDVTDAALEGFRVIGDAATPLGTGISVTNSELSMSGIEIAGAATAAVEVDATSQVHLASSDIHDNPGAALVVRPGANATISHNVFMRNGSANTRTPWTVEENSGSTFMANVFVGMSPDMFAGSSDARATLARDNWFVDRRPAARPVRPRPGGR
jgi:serine/threonine protein phosphatase PrpC